MESKNALALEETTSLSLPSSQAATLKNESATCEVVMSVENVSKYSPTPSPFLFPPRAPPHPMSYPSSPSIYPSSPSIYPSSLHSSLLSSSLRTTLTFPYISIHQIIGLGEKNQERRLLGTGMLRILRCQPSVSYFISKPEGLFIHKVIYIILLSQ